MGYIRTGFQTISKQSVLLESSKAIAKHWGKHLDKEVSRTVKSLTKSDNMRINNLFFEKLLTFENAAFDSSVALFRQFLTVASSFLNETGYIPISPSVIDYRTDPILNVDELIDLMLATRLPKFDAAMINGEYANIDTFASFLPEVIRRYNQVEHERPLMYDRFRKWLGHVGFKVFKAQPITQAERTAYVLYCHFTPGQPGHSEYWPNTPIAAVEQSDPLVLEIGALYEAVCLPGPFMNHMKMVSDCVTERLTAWFGLMSTEMKMCRGTMEPYGPFGVFHLTPQENIPWTAEDQLSGLTACASYFSGARPDASSFAIRIPNLIMRKGLFRATGMAVDDPSFRLTLTDEKDISNFTFEFYSSSRQRWINSKSNNATFDLSLAESALQNKSLGSVQMANATLEGFGLCTLTPRCMDEKVRVYTDHRISEVFLLPTAQGLQEVSIDVTSRGARYGGIETLPFASEFMYLPLKSFQEPAPDMVDYVASVHGLTMDERTRFAQVISIYHNTNRFKRITGRDAPIDRRRLCEALLFARTRTAPNAGITA